MVVVVGCLQNLNWHAAPVVWDALHSPHVLPFVMGTANVMHELGRVLEMHRVWLPKLLGL